MDPGLISFAFVAGIAAFFNPCGFALLPSYVSHYIGREGDADRNGLANLVKGLKLGGTVSFGFFTIFLGLGLIVSALGSVIARYIPWLASLIGVGLVILGVLMILNKAKFFSLPQLEHALDFLGLGKGTPIPNPNPHPHERDRLSFYYLYGISYAVASTSCTLPIFMVVVTQSFAQGLLNGFLGFASYAMGMTLLMLALSVAMAFSREVIYQYIRPLVRYVQMASAFVIIGAGIYLIWYNLFYGGYIRF
ncbi:MAG: cytochrome c biogenesis CcdA family protein [Candidatus Bipolaricaulia bacterium]